MDNQNVEETPKVLESTLDGAVLNLEQRHNDVNNILVQLENAVSRLYGEVPANPVKEEDKTSPQGVVEILIESTNGLYYPLAECLHLAERINYALGEKT